MAKKTRRKPSIKYDRVIAASEYKKARTVYLHSGGDSAYQEIKKRFGKKSHGIREAVNNALALYAKVTRENNLGPNDNVEEILKLTK